MGSKIQLDNRNIRISQNATITGYSYSNGYFITNSTGTLIKESFGVSTGIFIVPIGHSSTSYNRLDIFNSGVADDFRFRLSGNIELTGSIMDELFQNSSVDRTWYITNDFGNSIYLNITFYWISSHENPEFQSNQCFIAQHDGISWKRYGIYGSASNSGVDYNDMHYYSANGITTTNPISVGSCYFEQLAYRSINNGNWSDLNNWEVYDENTSNWISPYFYNYSCGEITYPSSLSKSILIRHNITVDVNIPEGINSTIVESSGNIIIPTGKNLLVVEPKSGETSSLSNSGTINVYGTFSGLTGTIIQNNPNSLFEYLSNNQEIFSCRYAKLKLTNGNKFNSGNTTSVYENIIFNNSNLILNNYNFTLETNAQVVGASQSNGYFVAVDDGFLIVEFNLGENVSRTLHVGGNYYSPAILSFENITTPGTMLCRIRETGHPFDPSSIKRYWTINRGTLNFSANYRLSLKYLDSDLPYLPQNSEEELQLIRKGAIFSIDNSPNYWTYYTVGTSNYLIDLYSNFATITHNHFSDFTLTPLDNPLPVIWQYANAVWNNKDAVISWITASEKNNKGFFVERYSQECKDFETIGFVEGIGNTMINSNYFFTDKNLYHKNQEIFYFRIKQVDYDNNFSYSRILTLSKNEIISNNYSEKDCAELILYPNPVKQNETLITIVEMENDQKFTIKLADSLGKEIYKNNLNGHEGTNIINLTNLNLKSGVYILSVELKNCKINKRFVVID